MLAGLGFYEDFVRQMNECAAGRLTVHWAMQTNGLHIDGAWARFFAENGFLIGLSLDGTAALHDRFRTDAAGQGTYGRVCGAAALLRQYGVPYNILCVVTQPLARAGKEVYAALREHGYIQFIPCLDRLDGTGGAYSLTPESYGPFLCTVFEEYCRDIRAGTYVSIRNFDNYIRMLAGEPPESCAMQGVCRCTPTVESDGGVYPCDFYVLDEWRLGSVHTDSFAAMLHSEKAAQFAQSPHASDAECARCRWLSLCRGGCRREREPQSALAPSRTRLCAAYRTFFEAEFSRMCEIAGML